MMKAMAKKTGSTKKPGENSKENDGLSEESRADGQQKKNEPSHDQKGVKAYDEQKRIFMNMSKTM